MNFLFIFTHNVLLRLNLLEYGLFERGGGIIFINCHHILSFAFITYSTVFWHTPGILCHSTSTHASRFKRGCRYPPEIGGEGYAECTTEVTRSGSEHCNLPRVCVDI